MIARAKKSRRRCLDRSLCICLGCGLGCAKPSVFDRFLCRSLCTVYPAVLGCGKSQKSFLQFFYDFKPPSNVTSYSQTLSRLQEVSALVNRFGTIGIFKPYPTILPYGENSKTCPQLRSSSQRINIPTTRYKHLGNNHPKISPAHVEIYLAEFVVQLLTLGSQGVRSAIDILVHHTPCITS